MQNLIPATAVLQALDELQFFLTPETSKMIGSRAALSDEKIIPPWVKWTTSNTPTCWSDGHFDYSLECASRTLGLWYLQWKPSDSAESASAHLPELCLA